MANRDLSVSSRRESRSRARRWDRTAAVTIAESALGSPVTLNGTSEIMAVTPWRAIAESSGSQASIFSPAACANATPGIRPFGEVGVTT
jgi:hypothetical protein